MSILGDNTTPSSGTWFDTTTNKQFWIAAPISMPAGGGIANSQSVYMGGHGATVTVQFMLWDNLGNIVYQTGNFTVASGASWKTWSSIAGTYIPSGLYILGFWSSGAVDWKFRSTGGVRGRSGLSSPNTATSSIDEYGGSGFGDLGAYIDYTPGGIARVRRSSAWTGGIAVQDRRSGAWTTSGLVQERRGGVWVPTT